MRKTTTIAALGALLLVGAAACAGSDTPASPASTPGDANAASESDQTPVATLSIATQSPSTTTVPVAPTVAPPPQPAVTFGDGTLAVGTDVPPGTYRAADPGQFCAWRRMSALDGSIVDTLIAAEANSAGPEIVTIAATDAGFWSEDCGGWTSEVVPFTASPTAPFVPGKYQVGTDIAAGTWRSSEDVTACFWERLSGFGGTFEEIITSDYTMAATTVTIAATDLGFQTHGCGTWSRVE